MNRRLEQGLAAVVLIGGVLAVIAWAINPGAEVLLAERNKAERFGADKIAECVAVLQQERGTKLKACCTR